jgi:SAM-dependent methyltransferase
VLFLENPPVDHLAEIYPSNYYSYREEAKSAIERMKARLDERMLRTLTRSVAGEQLRLLDVGGGTGYLATRARASDSRISSTTVVDIDEQCREDAEAQGHEFVASRIEDIDVDRSFDVILAVNLIEHVADPRGVLRAFRQVLSRGGRILVKTPNHDSLDARLFRHRSWGGYHCPRHWVLFDGASLGGAVADAGLRIERLSYTQGAPFWAVSLLHELQLRGLVSRRDDRAITEHPLFGPFAAVAAGFDLVRRPAARTSQMIAVVAHDA